MVKTLSKLTLEKCSFSHEDLGARSESKESLKKLLSNMMHKWAYEASQLLDGEVDVHNFPESSSTGHDDLKWLSSHGRSRYAQLPSHTCSNTESLLEGSFFTISDEFDGHLPQVKPRKACCGCLAWLLEPFFVG